MISPHGTEHPPRYCTHIIQGEKEEPKWKKIIQSKVAMLRKEISQITSEIKRLREHKRMSERQKYNRMWMSKQLGDKVLSISNPGYQTFQN